jgi:hypothetical protein
MGGKAAEQPNILYCVSRLIQQLTNLVHHQTDVTPDWALAQSTSLIRAAHSPLSNER